MGSRLETSEKEGKCPGCDASGAVGKPCKVTVCQKYGFHFVAERFWERQQARPSGTTDAWIGRMVGDYLLVDFIGSGGFGSVYLGLQQPLFRLRGAIKILDTSVGDAEFAEAMLDKFEDEAAALADLSHPNIVRLLKYGTQDDHPYLVMEYVDRGRTLLEEAYARAESGEPLPHEDLLEIIRKLLNGLNAAHSLQIVHRDIKPENIMIQRIAGDPLHVRILDFGMAKFVEKRNDSRWALGSPTYMAPEQLGRDKIGPWTDLFAVGVLCFELFTGRRPYPGDNDREVVALKLDKDYDPVARLGEDFAASFQTFLRKALAGAPEDRFQTTDEFWEALSRATEDISSADLGGRRPVAELTSLLESRDLVEVAVGSAAPQTIPPLPAPPSDEPPPLPGPSGRPPIDAPPLPQRSRRGEPSAELGFVEPDSRPLLSYETELTAWDRCEIAWEKFVGWLVALDLRERLDRGLDETTEIVDWVWDLYCDAIMELADQFGSSDLARSAGELAEQAVARVTTCPLVEQVAGSQAFSRARRMADAIAQFGPAQSIGAVVSRVESYIGRRPGAATLVTMLAVVFLVAMVSLSWDAEQAPSPSVESPTTAEQSAASATDERAEAEPPAPEPVDQALPAPEPTYVPASGVVAVSAARSHTCALLDNAAVRCWGANRHGELGVADHNEPIGDDEPAHSAELVALDRPALHVVAAGDLDGSLSCALVDGDQLYCWGRHPMNASTNTPVAVRLDADIIDLDVGGSRGAGHGCVVTDDNAVRCFGANRFGQLGYGHTQPIGDAATLDEAGDIDVGGPVRHIAVGQEHSCALLESGRVRCWGWNRAGQLGYGHTLNIGDHQTPSVGGDALIGGKATQIAAGRRHTCALLEGGQVRCWGWNEHGQLGYGHTRNIGDEAPPHSAGSVDVGGRVEQISAGGDHTCTLLEGGALRCWGTNSDGQLGYPGSLRGRPTPAELGDVDLGAKVVQVSAGFRHTCAVTDEGSLFCWGRNDEGQLGYGHTRPVGKNSPPRQAGPVPVLPADEPSASLHQKSR